MSVSIQSCPSCRTLLLSDTTRCPLCQHVVDRGADDPAEGDLADAVAIDEASDGVECGDCGEVVRRELVRCWRCGAFMRPEIAARYREMQENPSPVIYSDADVLEDTPPQLSNSGQESGSGPEDDFVLAEGVSMSEVDAEIEE
ncbi:MAG: hypothetical protein QF363_03325, partial [Planctomycetaceae bacterium]|nr:hypothetical protein [Planctomycetaceae bacterium]